MLNSKIAEVTACLVSGALQSGKLPVEAERVAEYYAKLYDLIAELETHKPKQSQSGKLREIGRITEEPDEVG